MSIAGLVFKDVIINKKNIKMFGCMILITLVILLFAPLRAGYDESSFVFLGLLLPVGIFILIGGGLQCTIFTPDEHRHWAYFIGSAPNGAEKYTAAKYIFVLMTTFAAGAVCIIWDQIMATFYGDYVSATAMIYIATCVQLILRAIDIPFILRFGTSRGLNIKGILLAVLVFATIVYLLFGDISMFGSLDDFREWAIGVLTNPGDGAYTFITVSGLLALPGFYVSYRISTGLYVKGVERIENSSR